MDNGQSRITRNRGAAVVHVVPGAPIPAAFALLLLAFAGAAHAASIYKCVDPNGAIAFRDTPCATLARQTKMDVTGLPLIDPGAPRQRSSRRPPLASKHPASRHRRTGVRRMKPVMSWECRAADGEVFYRHKRCPGSVPGDGVVRPRYAETSAASHTRRRRNAWSRVPVHGIRIPRSEACRRIHSAGAAARDGHRRDANVSTYDHLMGRDPCS